MFTPPTCYKIHASPQNSGTHMFHATHGMRLHSIRKLGLVPNMPGRQLKTGKIFFGSNASFCLQNWSYDLIKIASNHPPFFRQMRLAEYAYQCSCLLRVSLHDLTALGYTYDLNQTYSGTSTIPASKIDIYFDGKWCKLDSVTLPRRPLVAHLLYKISQAIQARSR